MVNSRLFFATVARSGCAFFQRPEVKYTAAMEAPTIAFESIPGRTPQH
ncbi:MAG: hypothetical protein ACT4TC_02055 [Myxococcaceae bacterium]